MMSVQSYVCYTHGTAGKGACPYCAEELSTIQFPSYQAYGAIPVPHKCPSCDGFGKRETQPEPHVFAGPTEVVCISCEGKGVLWR